jgi:hypothetical protein
MAESRSFSKPRLGNNARTPYLEAQFNRILTPISAFRLGQIEITAGSSLIPSSAGITWFPHVINKAKLREITHINTSAIMGAIVESTKMETCLPVLNVPSKFFLVPLKDSQSWEDKHDQE